MTTIGRLDCGVDEDAMCISPTTSEVHAPDNELFFSHDADISFGTQSQAAGHGSLESSSYRKDDQHNFTELSHRAPIVNRRPVDAFRSSQAAVPPSRAMRSTEAYRRDSVPPDVKFEPQPQAIEGFSESQQQSLRSILDRIQAKMARRVCVRCQSRVLPTKLESYKDKKSRQSKASKPSENPLCNRCYVGSARISCSYCGVDTLLHPDAKMTHEILARHACIRCLRHLCAFGPPKAKCQICDYEDVWPTQRNSVNTSANQAKQLCDRCSRYRNLHGPPAPCNFCGKVAAFNKGMDYIKSMDNKLLCFGCTINYKREKHHEQHKLSSSKKKRKFLRKLPPPGFASDILASTRVSFTHVDSTGFPPLEELLCPHELIHREGTMQTHRDAKYWYNRLMRQRVRNTEVQRELDRLNYELKASQREVEALNEPAYGAVIETTKREIAKRKNEIQGLKQELEEIQRSAEAEASTVTFGPNQGQILQLVDLSKHRRELGEEFEALSSSVQELIESNDSLKRKNDKESAEVSRLTEKLNKLRKVEQRRNL